MKLIFVICALILKVSAQADYFATDYYAADYDVQMEYELTSGVEKHCGDVMTYSIDGYTFWINRTIEASWHEAREFCESSGMQLIEIRYDEDNTRVVQFLDELSTCSNWIQPRIWLGAQYHNIEQQFYWISLDPIRSFNTNNPNETCVFMGNKIELYEWSDANCTAVQHNFMCSFSMPVVNQQTQQITTYEVISTDNTQHTQQIIPFDYAAYDMQNTQQILSMDYQIDAQQQVVPFETITTHMIVETQRAEIPSESQNIQQTALIDPLNETQFTQQHGISMLNVEHTQILDMADVQQHQVPVEIIVQTDRHIQEIVPNTFSIQDTQTLQHEIVINKSQIDTEHQIAIDRSQFEDNQTYEQVLPITTEKAIQNQIPIQNTQHQTGHNLQRTQKILPQNLYNIYHTQYQQIPQYAHQQVAYDALSSAGSQSTQQKQIPFKFSMQDTQQNQIHTNQNSASLDIESQAIPNIQFTVPIDYSRHQTAENQRSSFAYVPQATVVQQRPSYTAVSSSQSQTYNTEANQKIAAAQRAQARLQAAALQKASAQQKIRAKQMFSDQKALDGSYSSQTAATGYGVIAGQAARTGYGTKNGMETGYGVANAHSVTAGSKSQAQQIAEMQATGSMVKSASQITAAGQAGAALQANPIPDSFKLMKKNIIADELIDQLLPRELNNLSFMMAKLFNITIGYNIVNQDSSNPIFNITTTYNIFNNLDGEPIN